MNRQGAIFFGSFAVTASVIARFVYFDRTFWALAFGIAGVVAHWLWSQVGSLDDEIADASYFFGFMLTLVFLAVGLFKLAAVSSSMLTPDGKEISNTVNTTKVVLGFLKDLAAGLSLTIVGLLVRQIRTLKSTDDRSTEQSLLGAQRELTRNLDTVAKMWQERSEHQLIEELHQSRVAARDATASLQSDIIAAGKQMLTASGKLADASTKATETMTRTASAFGEELSKAMERVKTEVELVLKGIEQQRVLTTEALREGQSVASQIRADADEHLREHLELWRGTIDDARAALSEAHRGLQEEYARGLEGFASSGKAFAELTERIVTYVETLPNPADRLAGLWDGVASLESSLKSAVQGSIREFGGLTERSEKLATALGRLGGSTNAAATAFDSGGERFVEELTRELHQMNTLVDEYVSLLKATTKSLVVRS